MDDGELIKTPKRFEQPQYGLDLITLLPQYIVAVITNFDFL
jgi:hypothetical protein